MSFFNKQYDEMMRLKRKTKDSNAQAEFNQWYNSLDDNEKNQFNKYNKKMSNLGLAIIAIILLFVVGSCMKDNKKQESVQIQTTETKNEQTTQKPLLSGEAADKAEITDIVKKSASHADFRDITITKVVDSDRYNLVVFLNGRDNLTTNLIYSSYKFSCRDIFKGLYTSSMGPKINDVKISIYTGMVNTQTGAKSDSIIYMLAMTRVRAKQMHWNNIESVDIEQAATERFIHPALRRELNKK